MRARSKMISWQGNSASVAMGNSRLPLARCTAHCIGHECTNPVVL